MIYRTIQALIPNCLLALSRKEPSTYKSLYDLTQAMKKDTQEYYESSPIHREEKIDIAIESLQDFGHIHVAEIAQWETLDIQRAYLLFTNPEKLYEHIVEQLMVATTALIFEQAQFQTPITQEGLVIMAGYAIKALEDNRLLHEVVGNLQNVNRNIYSSKEQG